MAEAAGALPGRPGAPALILASASRSRRRLLEQAGLRLRVEPASVDEDEVKRAMRAEGATAGEVALGLAELKAQRISRRAPDALVIGADQMLECGGRWFDKPGSRAEAADHLRWLAGRSHSLVTAVCVVLDGTRIWHHLETARLTMRDLGEGFLAAYLEANGARTLESVGAYQLEGLGAQLFERIEDDYFTILGLPLLPLLGFLRGHGVVES